MSPRGGGGRWDLGERSGCYDELGTLSFSFRMLLLCVMCMSGHPKAGPRRAPSEFQISELRSCVPNVRGCSEMRGAVLWALAAR